jgi:hypothetical protein
MATPLTTRGAPWMSVAKPSQRHRACTIFISALARSSVSVLQSYSLFSGSYGKKHSITTI